MNNAKLKTIFVMSLLVSSTTFAETIKVVGSMSSENSNASEIVSESLELEANAGQRELTRVPEYNPMRPTIKKDYRELQAELDEVPQYLKLKVTMSKRLVVLPDGKIRFLASSVSLKDNIVTLLSHTETGIPYFQKDFPENMRLFNEFYLYGDNVLDIVDQLIEPFTSKHNVHAFPHLNNVIEFTFTRRD